MTSGDIPANFVTGSIPLPEGLILLGKAPSDAVVEMILALKQSNFAELERQLYEGTYLSVLVRFMGN